MGGQGTYFNGADPYTPAPTGSANTGQRALDGPGYPHMVCAPALLCMLAFTEARLSRCFILSSTQ